MNGKIDNKIAFKIYMWINFCFIIGTILYLAILFGGFVFIDKSLIKELKTYVFIGPIFVGLLQIVDYFIKPSYFEARITSGQIIIKTFNPNKINGLRLLFMLHYDKHLMEQVIDKQFYNNYKIKIDRLGFRKSLTLQKIDNGNIYESKPINISFLGVRKYTDLILSIDRLREKITMN